MNENDAIFGSDPERLKRLVHLGLDADEPDAEERPPIVPAVTRLLERAGSQIGRYRLLECIGEGGMGVVYLAEQVEPICRRVALKIIKLGMDSKQVIARFEAERQTLALMDHPNIAKVLDAGLTETGRPYFVMELVRGAPVTDYCDQEKLSTRSRLDLFVKVCHALQHAHQKGVIHRDIKPSNILVTVRDGTPVPKIIDFGIAKATEQGRTEQTVYTQFQQFIGTPAYMSPEQAEMRDLDIDTRSDIYSLGVLLYELLAGSTPFDTRQLMKSGLHEMRKIIREQEPARPSTRLAQTLVKLEGEQRPGTHHSPFATDLDWIVMKCLEKDRTRRYETADALAMDIERHLHDEPILARPPSSAYRLQKAWRRNKVIYSSGILLVLSLVAGITVSAWQAKRARVNEKKAVQAQVNEELQRQHAEDARGLAQAQEFVARQRAYASDMNVAKQALAAGNLGRTLDLLDRQRPKPGQEDLRGWEWRYLWQQTRSDALFTLCQQSSQIHSLAISPDGHWLAVGVYHKGGLSVWDLRTRRQVIQLAEQELEIFVAFSPTGSVLAFTGVTNVASGKRQATLHLYNVDTRQMMVEIPLDALCKGLVFSGDGETLVTSTSRPSPGNPSGSSQGIITLWRIPDGTKLASYASEQGNYGPATTAFAATPDLSLAAYGLQLERIRVLDLRDGKELWTAVASEAAITTLAFSPDGKTLASAAGFSEEDIRLWDVATGQETGRLEGHGAFVSSLVFWPDGKKLASSSGDQTMRIWDVAGRTCLDTLRGHPLEVFRLALLPDGKTLVSGCKDGTVCVWDTSVTHPRQPHITLPGSFGAWCFEPDGQSLLTVDENGVTRWSGLNFEQSELLPDIATTASVNPVFSRDGHFLAAGSNNGVIQVWDLQRHTLRCQLKDMTGSQPLDFFGDGNGLFIWSGASIDAWDLVTELKTYSWKSPLQMSAMAISPNARQLIAIGWQGDTLCAGLDNSSERNLDLHVLEASSATYSPDGGLFAVSSGLGFARVWDTTSWCEPATLRGYLVAVQSVAFSPDGKRLATSSDNQEALRLWETDSWQDVLTLEGPGAHFNASAFSPDGNVIGAKKTTGNLYLWRAPSLERINALEAKQRRAERR